MSTIPFILFSQKLVPTILIPLWTVEFMLARST